MSKTTETVRLRRSYFWLDFLAYFLASLLALKASPSLFLIRSRIQSEYEAWE